MKGHGMINLALTWRWLRSGAVPAAALAMGLAVAALSRTALAYGQHDGDGYGHMWAGGMSMMFAGPLVMIVVLAVIVVLVVLAVRWLLPGSGSPSAASGAQAILDERFARGEIEAEEYRARSAELQK